MPIVLTVEDTLTFTEGPYVDNLTTVPFYGTLAEANNYFAVLLQGKKWKNFTTDDKLLALKSATLLIDNLNFAGDKTDEGQTLEFPRNGDTVVPDKIKKACFESAMALLRKIDLERERDNLFTTARGYGQFSKENRHPESVQPWIVAGIPSSYAWDYLLPFLRPRTELTLLRIN